MDPLNFNSGPLSHGYFVSSEELYQALLVKPKVAIDLNAVDSTSGLTLFSKWAVGNEVQLTQAMIDYDSSVLTQINRDKNSLFEKAVCAMSKKGAHFLLTVMEKWQLPLSEKDQWIKRAFTDEGAFIDQNFSALPPSIKRLLFRVANAYVSKEFIKKVRPLGMDETPYPPLIGVELISPNMDALKVIDTIEQFLKGLRKSGLLFTAQEFANLNPSRYRSKSCQIGRILGRNHLQNITEQLGLKHMKVPKKIAVIKNGRDVNDLSILSIRLRSDLEPICNDLEIFAENITPVDRKLSREELGEYLTWMFLSGFNDFVSYGNFIVAADGLYAIDTEYGNFSTTPTFDTTFVTQLSKLVADEDREWLAKEFTARVKQYQAQQQNIAGDWDEVPKQATYSIKWEDFGFKDRQEPFTFKIDELLAIKKV